MKPSQLELLTTVSAPSLSPDGRHAVFAASRPSFDADSGVGQLWILELDGAGGPTGPARRFTRGSADAAPSFSPDGKAIAFLRPDEKGRPQLALLDARGGEPRILTDRHLGVSAFTWSPESTRIAFASRTPEEGRYGTIEGVGAGAEDPRRIDGFQYRFNGLGFSRDKRQGIHLIQIPPLGEEPYVKPVGRAAHAAAAAKDPAAGTERAAAVAGARNEDARARKDDAGAGSAEFPATRLLTPADRDCGEPEFSPDGTYLYFSAALHEGADRDLRSMIHRVAIDGADELPELVAGSETESLSFTLPRFSRDGRWLYMLGDEVGDTGLDFVARSAALFVLPADGSGSVPRRLSDPDAIDYAETPVLARHGQSSVMVLARVRGSAELHRLDADGSTDVLVAGRLEVTGADEEAGTVVVSFSDPSSPGEIAVAEAGSLLRLTDFAAGLRAQTRIAAPRELVVESADGYPVHGWVYLPEGEGPHPVLLNIHGGPYHQYGWSYFDEAQVYTQAGYAVVQCNPRGSASYGREHGLAIKEAMGTVDLQDVLAFLDGAIADEKSLDGTRLGVLGGSYGGYLTAWTIAHDHRFAAAIVERGFLDPLSFIGTSDIGWFFSEEYTGRDVAHTLTQSPLAKVAEVRTPTLVLHSEEDYRCPIEQAQRYFVELLRHGVEAEFLLFPGENHELSRSGTPWHRRQRFEAILDWWNRYLPVARRMAEDNAAV